MVVETVIPRVKLPSAVLNMETLNIVLNVRIILVHIINMSMNTTPLLRINIKKKDLKKAQRIGIKQYNLEQKEKIQILSYLLSNHNDGRRKNFFCIAVNLLEVSELQEVMKLLQSNVELSLLPAKERSLYVVNAMKEIAERRNIEVRLRRKSRKDDV